MLAFKDEVGRTRRNQENHSGGRVISWKSGFPRGGSIYRNYSVPLFKKRWGGGLREKQMATRGGRVE